MSEYVWHWTKGNSKIFTRKLDVAEKAMRDGLSVIGVKAKSNIIRY
jgi:hypothetical protein